VDPTSRDHADLAAALARVLGPRAGISELVRLSGGASRETWAFDAEHDGVRRPLIVRRDPPGRPSEPGTMGLEHRLLRAAHEAGLAVPEVVASDDGGLLGTPGIVMARVPGETTTPCIPSGNLNRSAKPRSRSRTDRPSEGPRWLDGCGVGKSSLAVFRSRAGRSASFTARLTGRLSRTTCSVATVPGCRAAINAINWSSPLTAFPSTATMRS